MLKTECKLLQSPMIKNCIDVVKTRWHFLCSIFPACTSIKVAVLLNKITDLPQEHSVLSTPSFTIGSFLRLPCCCDRDLFSLPASPGSGEQLSGLLCHPGQRISARRYSSLMSGSPALPRGAQFCKGGPLPRGSFRGYSLSALVNSLEFSVVYISLL